MSKEKLDFYDYLRTQFSTIEECHDFYQKWADEWDQELPEYGLFSLRAMAAHCSNVLEGKESEAGYFLNSYLDTKYGTTIFFRER